MGSTPPVGTGRNWCRYAAFDEEEETPSKIRNTLLVVFTLIASVTFQAGVNPPGGVWQDVDDHIPGAATHNPGTAIFASQKQSYFVFLIFNTLAFSYSIFAILSLTHKFPYHFGVWAATISMAITYVSSIFAVTPKDAVKFRFILLTAFGPVVIRFLIRIWYVCYKKFVNHQPAPGNYG